MKDFLTVLFSRPVVIRSIKISLIIGTGLSLINQHEYLIEGHINGKVLMKIFFNYLVPYLVSTYAAYETLKEQG